MKINTLLLSTLAVFTTLTTSAQQHSEQDHSKYVVPTDPLVQQKLAKWQDVKFGLMMHWGTYSQWGIVESWSLCPEDEGWCERKGPHSHNWYEYKKAYENISKEFNPVKFNPEKWATAAKNAGMKYLVFTTKHHDGFAMFDSKHTDYKITNTPFKSNPKSNITKEILSAFRNEGFMTGTYFSKPDWNVDSYWWPYFPPKDRNSTYDPKKKPEIWEKFKNFTYNQIEELMTDYGSVDILWLDGGWVRPFNTIDPKISWQKSIPYEQDIDMAKIAKMARSHQPGLLVVDRTVTGEFENYVTPEQQIPDHYMSIPWESCITMGDSWSYIPKENFKSTEKLVHTLVDIVAKGGNLLLNVAPGPDGEWHQEAYTRLEEIGKWMKTNSVGIYDTKPLAPYRQGKWAYTKKGNTTYAFYLADAGEKLPTSLKPEGLTIPKTAKITLAGSKKALKQKDGSVLVPAKTSEEVGVQAAYLLVIE
ncbi:alpha-L-fucosidase [Dyadobacter sp. CY312]|uniref:alpha-L-fucosidase n=1 Tax=Dyadobacter sp. CY312 TaxID=2907303 RepID=UPI001F207FE1|nr:alpha-L-fucosidase [Dyadobacter sp. CY312]MCE7040788.1 alpha-L-fucosidase [Dyadobacter sp. CY312]